MRLYLLPVLLFPFTCLGIEFIVTFDSDPAASHYMLESSTDGGDTWMFVDVNIPSSSYTVDAREPGTTLFRVNKCFSSGACERDRSGFWIKLTAEDLAADDPED